MHRLGEPTEGAYVTSSNLWFRKKAIDVDYLKRNKLYPKIFSFKTTIIVRLINSPYEVKYRRNEYHNNLKYQ